MKPRLLRVLCLAAALAIGGEAIAQGKCRFVKIVDWPARSVRNHIVVEGAINGNKVGITLDTGAQKSLVMRSAAVRLDLPRRDAPGMRMIGVGGETKMEIATVDEFKLGESSAKGMQLFVAGEHDFGEGIDVLLGEDFLRRFDVEFDLAHNAVRLFQARDCDGVSLAYWAKENVGEVEMERIDEERPQITVAVRINDRPIEAILDSGATSSVMTKHDAAAAGVTPETPGVVVGPPSRGLGGKPVEEWIGPFKSFAIGNESIPDVRIRFADLWKESTYQETGSRIGKKVMQTQPMLLGADFLRSHRTLIAHSQRRVYYTYTGGPVFQVARPPPAN